MVNAHWHPFFWNPPLLLVGTQVFIFPFLIVLPLLSRGFFLNHSLYCTKNCMYCLLDENYNYNYNTTIEKIQVILQQNNVM